MYNCFDISNEFLKLAQNDGVSITPMKLLKLVYIAHGYHLGFKKGKLITNDIQAWEYGPVIPDLYHVIKKFGKRPVDKDYIELLSPQDLNQQDQDFISLVWNAFRDFDGLQLSTLTHEDGSPWEKTYEKGVYNKSIPSKEIEDYYTNLINERSNKSATTD